MTIQCKEIEFCKMEVHYVATPETVEQKRQEAVQQLRKVAIPGFRAGRAPDYIIKLRLKKQIEDWMKRELVAQAYDDILFETKMKPIGYPQLNKLELNESAFWCDLTVLKKPEFELKQYTGFKVPKPHQLHTPTEMAEKMMQELRQRFGDIVPYGENDFVQMGDKVTLDFKCLMDDKVFDEATKEGALYTVGQNIFPGFDDNVLGMSAGEERSFDVVLGDNVAEDMKNKRVTFQVKVHMGMKTVLAALDDALAQKAGFENYDKMRETVEGIASSRAQSSHVQLVGQQVIKQLLAAHDFEVPTWLVSMEAQHVAKQVGAEWNTVTDDQKSMFLAQAKDNVKLALIMDTIRDKEPEATFSDNELFNVIKTRVQEAGQDPDKFLVEAQRDGRLVGLLSSLRNEATIQWLVDQSTIIE